VALLRPRDYGAGWSGLRDPPPRIGGARARRQVAGASDRAARWELGCLGEVDGGARRESRTARVKLAHLSAAHRPTGQLGPVEKKTCAVLSRSHTRRSATSLPLSIVRETAEP
jgi:hypothetical protein